MPRPVCCCHPFADQTRRFCSSKAAAPAFTTIMQGLNHYASAIAAGSTVLGIAYLLARQHVTQEVQLDFLKEHLTQQEKSAMEKAKALEIVSLEKEKTSIEKAKALEILSLEKEKSAMERAKALEIVYLEKEKALEKMLNEKEKTQAAEKRELEARIRELEARMMFERPPAF